MFDGARLQKYDQRLKKTSFNKLRSLFINKDILLPSKIRQIKCYIFPILLHGTESWATREAVLNKLKTFEIYPKYILNRPYPT